MTYVCRWHGYYGEPVGDGYADDGWSAYLRRMTSRPGWSVAKLAREAGLHRSTVFGWIKEGGDGLTVTSVMQIATALGDDPINALRAAAGIPERTYDEEIAFVVNHPTLRPRSKETLLRLIRERRAAQRQQAIDDTRRMVAVLGEEP